MLGGGRGGVDGLGLSAGGTTLWPILALGLTLPTRRPSLSRLGQRANFPAAEQHSAAHGH